MEYYQAYNKYKRKYKELLIVKYGGAMGLRAGQDIWYYLNEINNEYNLLREELRRQASAELVDPAEIREIRRSHANVIRELERITAPNGMFGSEMSHESAGLTEALNIINDNNRVLRNEIAQAWQLVRHQRAIGTDPDTGM
jgi:hypothetical protein